MNDFIQGWACWFLICFIVIFLRHPLKRMAEHFIRVADGGK